MKSPPTLILASTSIYRRELLARVCQSFICVSPGVDETRLVNEPGPQLVQRLALAKASSVAALHPEAWVIGSDQVAALPATRADEPEIILGKPGTVPRCIEQLQNCSGRSMAYLTGVALVRQDGDRTYEFMDVTHVRFRELDRDTIERYVERESPLDCAGGFKSEGLGISLCESIESTDPSALIGLPLIRLCAVLRAAGFELP